MTRKAFQTEPWRFTEITIRSTPELIARALAEAIEADRLVWTSEVKNLIKQERRCEVRLILRNT